MILLRDLRQLNRSYSIGGTLFFAESTVTVRCCVEKYFQFAFCSHSPIKKANHVSEKWHNLRVFCTTFTYKMIQLESSCTEFGKPTLSVNCIRSPSLVWLPLAREKGAQLNPDPFGFEKLFLYICEW